MARLCHTFASLIIDWLNKYYGRTKAIESGPLTLKTARQRFVDADHSAATSTTTWSESAASFAGRFQGGPADTLEAPRTVPSLRRGRSEAQT